MENQNKLCLKRKNMERNKTNTSFFSGFKPKKQWIGVVSFCLKEAGD